MSFKHFKMTSTTKNRPTRCFGRLPKLRSFLIAIFLLLFVVGVGDVFAISYLMLEDFEGFTGVDQELPDLITDNDWGGELDGKHWRSDLDSYGGTYALEDLWSATGNWVAKWTFDSSILVDSTFSFMFKPTDSTIDFYVMMYKPTDSLFIDLLRETDWNAWEWNKLSIDIDFQTEPTKVHLYYYVNDTPLFDQSFDGVSELVAFSIGRNVGTASYMNIDDVGLESPPSSINITSPTTTSELTEEFNLEGDFNIQEEDWNRMMIVFEQWDASSTCPSYMSDDWETETSNGWFFYQSMPFFSDLIATTTGNFSILIDDLRTGNYNCTKCFFINETEQTKSPQKCQGYSLTITEITPLTAEFYYPFMSWSDYYSTSSERYATSTVLFENIANAFSPIFDRMGDFILYAKDYFNLSEATAKGKELGQAIPKARGYLEMVDDFINLPLSSFVSFYFLTLAVVISYKIILTIIKLLKP